MKTQLLPFMSWWRRISCAVLIWLVPAVGAATVGCNRFMEASEVDEGWGATMDGSGNKYVMDGSNTPCSSPADAHAGGIWEAVIAQLLNSCSSNGNALMDSLGSDECLDIAAFDNNMVHVTIYGQVTWGDQGDADVDDDDAFVTQFSTDSTASEPITSELTTVNPTISSDSTTSSDPTASDPTTTASITSDPGCKHAIYSLDDQTLAIPAVEVPVLSVIDQQPTGETTLLTGILKQHPTDSTQFSILFLSEVFPETIAAASNCPATYSLTSGVLSVPWVDMPVVGQLGSEQSRAGVEVFKVIMQWEADLELFVVEQIQRVE